MKKKFLLTFGCVATSITTVSPLLVLASCGHRNTQYDKIANTLYKTAITEFAGSEVASAIFKDVTPGIAGITSIPRPSGNLDQIRKYLKDRLTALGVTNIYENKDAKDLSSMWFDIPASADGANIPKIIIQGHMDLVFAFDKAAFPEGNPDPLTYVIKPTYDKDRNSIHTEGYKTSLGADNGIGVAMMLAMLIHKDEPGFKHGPIRCIITADEETGMKGANALVCDEQGKMDLKTSEKLVKILDAPYLINVDGETIGEIVTSTAGGVGSHYRQNFERKTIPDWEGTEFNEFTVTVSGLKGGHSGVDINNWCANAIKMIAQILNYCDTRYLQLINLTTPGIEAYNSIPDICSATFAFAGDRKQVENAAEYVKFVASREYTAETYDNIKIDIEDIPDKKYVYGLSHEDTRSIYFLIQSLWYGPYSWSDPEKKIVETSANVGPAELTVSQDASDKRKYPSSFKLSTYSRSQKDEDVTYFYDADKKYCNFYLGEDVKTEETDTNEPEKTYTKDSIYPGWAKGQGQSTIHDLIAKGFKEFDVESKDVDIHGGVEDAWWCLAFKQLAADSQYKSIFENWSQTAIGATIEYCHNPKEELHLDAVTQAIKTILYTLDNLK